MRRLPLARRERHDLCDLALALGADAPTLSGDWTTADLMAHLLVREHRPLGAAGIFLPVLSRLTERSMERARRQDFGVLVEKVREPGLTPYAVPPVEVLANTLEYLVHHEDLRRAQVGWQPRELADDDLDRVWRSLKLTGRVLARAAGVPLVVRRTDTDATATLRPGGDPVKIAGPVVELVLFLFGRQQVRELRFTGPEERVAKLKGSDLGL